MATLVNPEPYNPKPLNGAQFSQLGLFALPKPTAEHRWPAGYSPERKAAVAASLDVGRTEVHHSHTGVSGEDVYLPSSKFFSYNDPPTYSAAGNPQGKWSRSLDEIHQVQREHAVRAQTDIIARSTIPLEHLENMPAMHVRETDQGSAGYFAKPGMMSAKPQGGSAVHDPESWERGRIQVDPRSGSRAWQEKTLIHEVGHHVDYRQDPAEFNERANYENEPIGDVTASPSLEGYAEGYAHGHYRPRRGSKEEGIPARSLASYRSFQGKEKFDKRFAEASGGITPQEAFPKPVHMGPQFGTMEDHPHLFSRDAPSEETSAPGYKDVGQHPLTKYWEDPGSRELGTISTKRAH